jgi:RluA family pseudouridine synthase
VTEDYALRSSDFLEHETIRFEPPIPDLPIRIISQTAEIVVVDKPPGMVVHTGGGYHNNTLLGILHFEHGLKNLFVLHRLDRLTSGLVILARVKDKTTKFHEESKGEVMKKCYFARVSGDVKFESEVVNVGMVCLSFKEGVWAVYQKETMFGLLKNQQVKDSSTKFVKVWYDEKTDSSLLECYPITGRTHQIRVHLQHIGHPILNDVVYGGRFIGNPTINNIIDNIQQNKSIEENDEDVVDKVEKRVKGLEEDSKKEKEVPNKNDHKNSLPSEYKEWYEKWEYKKRPLEIMLHSHKYTFEGTTYIGSKPYWT